MKIKYKGEVKDIHPVFAQRLISKGDAELVTVAPKAKKLDAAPHATKKDHGRIKQ
jgi:hypothetical protein